MPVRFFRTGITVNLPCRLRDTWSQEIENIPEIVQRLMVIAKIARLRTPRPSDNRGLGKRIADSMKPPVEVKSRSDCVVHGGFVASWLQNTGLKAQSDARGRVSCRSSSRFQRRSLAILASLFCVSAKFFPVFEKRNSGIFIDNAQSVFLLQPVPCLTGLAALVTFT